MLSRGPDMFPPTVTAPVILPVRLPVILPTNEVEVVAKRNGLAVDQRLQHLSRGARAQSDDITQINRPVRQVVLEQVVLVLVKNLRH